MILKDHLLIFGRSPRSGKASFWFRLGNWKCQPNTRDTWNFWGFYDNCKIAIWGKKSKCWSYNCDLFQSYNAGIVLFHSRRYTFVDLFCVWFSTEMDQNGFYSAQFSYHLSGDLYKCKNMTRTIYLKKIRNSHWAKCTTFVQHKLKPNNSNRYVFIFIWFREIGKQFFSTSD